MNFLLLFAVSVLQVGANRDSLDHGYSLVRVQMDHPATEKLELGNILKSVQDKVPRFQTADYRYVSPEVAAADVVLSRKAKRYLLAELKSHHLKWTVLSNDVLKEIEEAEAVNDKSNPTIYDTFLTWEEIKNYLKEIKANHSDIVELFDSGMTYENRSMTFVKVGKCDDCPAIFIEAGIHAREWISHAVALNLIDKLVNLERGHKYLTSLTWYILPVTNPDGYVFSHTKNRLWRKNRNLKGASCDGVDLNRNFDYDWGNTGTFGLREASSSNCSTDNYHGPGPASEPEVKAIVNFVAARSKRIQAYIALHSFSQFILLPCPPSHSLIPVSCFGPRHEMKKVADLAAEAIKDTNGTEYEVDTPQNFLYYASGCSDLWAMYNMSIPLAYTIEMRPESSPSQSDFIIKPDQIKPTSEEIWAAFKVFAEAVLARTANA